jgi:hypothetical protein
MTSGPVAVINCFSIADERKIEKHFELDCEVKGLGRDHIQRIKDAVRKPKRSQRLGEWEGGKMKPMRKAGRNW